MGGVVEWTSEMDVGRAENLQSERVKWTKKYEVHTMNQKGGRLVFGLVLKYKQFGIRTGDFFLSFR